MIVVEGRETTLGAVCMATIYDKAANLKKYHEIIDEAAEKGVGLLVFPEVSLQGYLPGPDYHFPKQEQVEYYTKESETLSGPSVTEIAERARRHNMYIQMGMAERNEPATAVYNSAVLIGPEGVIGAFRKVHAFTECPPFLPGIAFPVFDTALGRMGPFICADLCYPESMRLLAVKGAVIGTFSTAFPKLTDEGDPLEDYNAYLYRLYADAQAALNKMWLVQSNHVGFTDAPGSGWCFGNSRIVSPWGKVVAECGFEEALVTATVDIAGEIHRVRTSRSHQSHRRPELYGDLATQDGGYGPY